MASEKKARPESLDFFLASIAPIFIIGMIGSLVYFLIIVCYEGPFTARLMWILGLYTVAAVLIARIAIEQSRQLAFTYMFALGAATLFVAPQFMTISGPMAAFSFPILLGLLVLVAVLADRITFDCTSMNEQEQSTGVGLLQSLGLVESERKAASPNAAIKEAADSPDKANSKIPTAKKSSRRKHNPGVWVLYFALLALPLFGLGQLAIKSPLDRRWAFTYLFGYLLSSLFLLVLISLLSLRKYLRERGVPMETAFAARWLAIGMTSVFVVLFLLSMLPIPSHSLLSMELPFHFTSRDDLKANKWGWGNEGAPGEGPELGKGEDADDPGENGNNQGQPSDRNPNDAKGDQAKAGDRPNGNKPNGDRDGKSPSKNGTQESDSQGGKQDGGKQPSDSKQGDSKQGDNKQGNKAQEDQRQSEADDGSQPDPNKKSDADPNQPDNNQNDQREPQKNKEPAAKKNSPDQEPKREPPQGEKPQRDQPPPPPPQQQGDQPKQEKPPEPPPQKSPSMSIEWNLPALVQWLVMLVLLVVAVIFGIKYRKELMQAMRDFADWMNALLGRKKKPLPQVNHVVEGATTITDLYPPFHSFTNPFQAGSGWSREQMVRHMYLAVLSWGYERRVVRTEEETPEEFIRRLGRRFPEQQESLSMLGRFYNRIAYARGTISALEIKPMVELWQWLVAASKSVPPKTKAPIPS